MPSPPKIRNKTRISALDTAFQQCLARAIRQENEIKCIQIGKEEKLYLLTGDMILVIQKTRRNSFKKLLELINKFSKVAEYKINTRKSVVFFHTCNEQPKNEIKKTVLFTTASKRIKYLRVNATKKV